MVSQPVATVNYWVRHCKSSSTNLDYLDLHYRLKDWCKIQLKAKA